MSTTIQLFNHGIQNENSDIRAHVGVLAQTVYVFQTKNWQFAVSQSQAAIKSASQPGVIGSTATGYVVPIDCIPDIKIISLVSESFWNYCNATSSLQDKGKFAVGVVRYLLRKGMFPLWIANSIETTDKELQIDGTDIQLDVSKRIQVKCDYKAGNGPGCTGNLYLQMTERNPNKIH